MPKMHNYEQNFVNFENNGKLQGGECESRQIESNLPANQSRRKLKNPALTIFIGFVQRRIKFFCIILRPTKVRRIGKKKSRKFRVLICIDTCALCSCN